jgi:hypothetical protein
MLVRVVMLKVLKRLEDQVWATIDQSMGRMDRAEVSSLLYILYNFKYWMTQPEADTLHHLIGIQYDLYSPAPTVTSHELLALYCAIIGQLRYKRRGPSPGMSAELEKQMVRPNGHPLNDPTSTGNQFKLYMRQILSIYIRGGREDEILREMIRRHPKVRWSR